MESVTNAINRTLYGDSTNKDPDGPATGRSQNTSNAFPPTPRSSNNRDVISDSGLGSGKYQSSEGPPASSMRHDTGSDFNDGREYSVGPEVGGKFKPVVGGGSGSGSGLGEERRGDLRTLGEGTSSSEVGAERDLGPRDTAESTGTGLTSGIGSTGLGGSSQPHGADSGLGSSDSFPSDPDTTSHTHGNTALGSTVLHTHDNAGHDHAGHHSKPGRTEIDSSRNKHHDAAPGTAVGSGIGTSGRSSDFVPTSTDFAHASAGTGSSGLSPTHTHDASSGLGSSDSTSLEPHQTRGQASPLSADLDSVDAPHGPTGTAIKTATPPAPFQPSGNPDPHSSSNEPGSSGALGGGGDPATAAQPSVGAAPTAGSHSGAGTTHSHSPGEIDSPHAAAAGSDTPATRRKSIPLVTGQGPAGKMPTPAPGLGQSTGEGTGQLYEKSTGLAAEGGDFDAARPGAGREADRLLDEKGVHHGKDVGREDHAHTGSHGHGGSSHGKGVGSKIKEKLHLGSKH